MTHRIIVFFTVLLISNSALANSANKAVALSQDLIWNLHYGKNTTSIENSIATLEKNFFKDIELKSEQQIFWINLYNGFLSSTLQKDSNLLKNNKFLNDRRFTVAGIKVSLNDIEYLFLNSGLKPNGKEKRFVNKVFKSWMVDEVNSDIVYLLYRGYSEGPPIVHLEAGNFKAMITVVKWKFYAEQVKVSRVSCTVPAYIRDLSPIYFVDKEKMIQSIRENTLCGDLKIIYSDQQTIAPRHFYPSAIH